MQETNKGNYYFDYFDSTLTKESYPNRVFSKLILNGNYTTVQSIGNPLNVVGDFSITRDESFMIFDINGIRISFHKNDGDWTNPKSLGSKINFGLASWGPYISPDKKYLFYTTGTKTDYSDTYVYWVRIDGIADSLKKTNFIPYLKTPLIDQNCIVDHFFIYTIPDNTFTDDDGNNTLNSTATLENGGALPSWLSFSSKTMTFSGKPKSTGKISIKLIATDTAKDSVSCKFGIEIKDK